MEREVNLALAYITLLFVFPSMDCELTITGSGCPAGWRAFRTKCYKIFGSYSESVYKKTFKDAKNYCSLKQGTLTSIHSMDEQNFLTAYLGETTVNSQVWIGLEKQNPFGDHGSWIDGSEDTSFRNFAPGEPNGGLAESCFNMDIKTNIIGKWNDVPCSTIKGFICKMNRDQSKNDTTFGSDPDCPQEFVSYNDVCFRLVQDKETFWSAEEICETDFYGHLASIRDLYDEAFIATLTVDLDDDVWIGFSDHNNDLIKGRFAWTDGSHVYHTNWISGQPVDSSEDRCAVSRPKGAGWTVEDCAKKLSFVCAKAKNEKANNREIHIGRCPQGWIDVNNLYCYYIENNDGKTFQDATASCKSKAENGTLAMFESQHDLLLLGPHLRKFTNQEFLVGIKQSNTGRNQFRLVNNKPATFLPWAYGEPNNLYNEQCVEVDARTLKYNNIPCSIWIPFICQTEKDLKHTISGGEATKRGPTTASTLYQANQTKSTSRAPSEAKTTNRGITTMSSLSTAKMINRGTLSTATQTNNINIQTAASINETGNPAHRMSSTSEDEETGNSNVAAIWITVVVLVAVAAMATIFAVYRRRLNDNTMSFRFTKFGKETE